MLYVEEIPVEFLQKLNNITVKERETAEFECELNKENAQVKWFKGGLEILPNDNKYKYIADGCKYKLQVLDCELDDINDYAISFRGRKCAARLDVQELPADVLKPLENVSVYEKQEIVLECEFNRANCEAIWHKDNIEVKYSLGLDRFSKKVIGTVHRLTIYEAKLDDAGSYSCTVKKTKTSCDVKVSEKPVEVMKMLEDQEVVEKQKATFVCTLSKPRLKVTWFKNDQKLSENSRVQFVQEGKIYKLVIENAQLEDRAVYKIKFEDEAESSAELFVKEAPISLKSSLQDKQAVEEDEEAFFEVEMSKKISLSDEIRWTFNGRKIDVEDFRKYSMELENKICKLKIKKIALEDEGTYAVEVNGSRSSAFLSVNELPVKFIKQLKNLSGVEDQSVVFECELSKSKWKKTGNDVIVKWFKGERELKETSKYSMKRDGVTQSLTVKQLIFEDTAEYSAVVQTEKTTAKLDIQDGEIEFTTKLRDVEVTEKETAQFDCEVNKIQLSRTGESLPVVWYKKSDKSEDEKLYQAGRIEIVKLNKRLVLKINTSVVEDAGVYVISVGSAKAEAKLTVKEIPVVFKKPLEDQRAKEASNCTFECTVNRADKPVKWFINGELITKEDVKSGKYSISQEKNRLQLTINNLDLAKDNNCEITCQVGDKTKSHAKLRVDEEDIKFVERLADSGVKENDPAQFICKLSKLNYVTRPNQELDIKWFVKGKQVDLKSDNTRFSVEQLDTVLKLNISSVHAEDAGEIKCQVNGDIITTCSLAVEEEPVVFVKKLSDLTCEEIPGKVCFECQLNKSFVNAKWFRNGKEISSEDIKYDFGREGPKHFFHIKDVDGTDKGEYTIVLQGEVEKKCMATLTVKAAPKMFLSTKYKDTITIKRGQPLQIDVGFTAYPEPKFNWLVNDEPLKESSRTKIEIVKSNLITLVMNKTQRSDSGKYHLTLENDYGRESCNIKVNVLDKPAPPKHPKVSDISAEEMRVNWESPEDDGGSPVTSYVIEIRDYNRKSWSELDTVQSNCLTYLSKGLIQGNKYSYRISAENKYGRSDPTEIDEPVEAKYQFNVPNAPQNCQCKDIRVSGCVVTFEAPSFDGGSPITGYVIERRQTSTSRWLKVNKEPVRDLNLKVNDLIEGLEYEFRVIAENKAGQSEPSEPCKPFTAKNPFDKPGPPINVKVGEVTKSSIELSWMPPVSDGGAPITGYKIERRNPKTMKWISVDNLGRVSSQCNVTIPGLKEGNEYEFRVIATNAAGDGEPSASTPLIVAKNKIIGDKPSLLEPMQDLRVLVGESARFVAKIKAKPFPDIKWCLNERVLGSKDDFVSTFDNNSLELTLSNVQLKDQGVYKVTVTNALGELTTDAKLTVLKKPTIKYDPKLDKIFDVIAIQQNLHISCEVSGFPRPDVKWYKDKQEIIPGGDVSRALLEHGEQYATLHLNKTKRSEGGEYTVIAENEVGKTEANFTIRVLDVPTPPVNLHCVEITSFNCKLEWSAPKDDGNVPIIGYYIEKLDPKRGTYIRIDKTSLTEHYIDKLNRGQSYQFRVIAENKIGLSEPCEMLEPIIAKGRFDVPGAPGIPEISEMTDTSCRLDWEAPRKDGGAPIRGYFVEKRVVLNG